MPPINTVALLRDRPAKGLPLQAILIASFILQILGAVGLVGYLSLLSGQQAVNELTGKLRREMSAREGELKSYLDSPHVAVPESDFMSQMDADTRNTVLLCIAALVIVTAIGILTARWVIKPLVELNTAAQEIAKGKWNQTVEVQRSDEVEELARFNDRAAQLRNSFATLENKNAEWHHLDKLKDEFLAHTSHELRTPLNEMIGIAESMIDGATGKLSEVQERNLWIIAQNGHRLAHLVDDILDFSQPISRDELLARIYTHLNLSQPEALQIEALKYRSMFDNAVEGIFQSSPAGKFLRVNPALAKLFGYDSPAEMLADVQEIAAQIYVDRQKRNEFKQQLEQGEVRDFEVEVYRRDRSKIWVSIWARAVKNSQGNVLYYEGNCVDITQRKREEESLKQQLRELQFEIDHSQRERQVAAILGTDYFQQLLAEADELRYSDN